MMETDSSSFTSRSSPEGSRSGALNAKASPTSLVCHIVAYILPDLIIARLIFASARSLYPSVNQYC